MSTLLYLVVSFDNQLNSLKLITKNVTNRFIIIIIIILNIYIIFVSFDYEV